jgi:hypothetical protein
VPERENVVRSHFAARGENLLVRDEAVGDAVRDGVADENVNAASGWETAKVAITVCRICSDQ